jgi:hypothetical protein
MSDPDTPPSHRIRSVRRSRSPVQEIRHQYELLILKHILQRTLTPQARPQPASSSRPSWHLTNALHWVKKRLTRSKACSAAVSASGTFFESMASTRATSRGASSRGEELESQYASCHGSDNCNYGDLCPLYESRDMEVCEAHACPSYEQVVGSRGAEMEDDATFLTTLRRVDSSVSMAACALQDWELLDDPTVDYCHLFASPGRRQAKKSSSALLVLSSFTLPPMFVLLRTPCLHMRMRERNLRLLHGKSWRRLELRISCMCALRSSGCIVTIGREPNGF